MGSINLFVSDVLTDGPQRWLYGATMAACLAAAVPLVVRQRVGRWSTFGLMPTTRIREKVCLREAPSTHAPFTDVPALTDADSPAAPSSNSVCMTGRRAVDCR